MRNSCTKKGSDPFLSGLIHITGCANNTLTYGAINSVIGGFGGAVIGGAIGVGAGYVIGNEQDKEPANL